MNVDRGHLLTDLPPDEEHAPRRRITVEDLRTHHDEIVAIGRRYGVSNIRVFGSVARGEADERSDLDLFIDVAPGHGYFDMTGFALDVEQLMGVFTQVATPNGQLALVHLVQIIGEAASRVPVDLRQRHPEIPWRHVVGMRNRVVHGYFEPALDHEELDDVFEAGSEAVAADG